MFKLCIIYIINNNLNTNIAIASFRCGDMSIIIVETGSISIFTVNAQKYKPEHCSIMNYLQIRVSMVTPKIDDNSIS